MSFAIAVSGKGGTGKTTLAALIIKSLINSGKKPVLAVDADANANLNEVLGVTVPATVGSIREDLLAGVRDLPASMSKAEILDMNIHSSLVEATGFDLLVMGRPEGPGCYCFANNLIRDIIERLSDDYPAIVMDNEAGMEHLSRRTTQKLDVLLIIADPIRRSILTAKRIAELADEMDLKVASKKLVINRVKGDLSQTLKEYANSLGLEIAACIPEDEKVSQFDAEGIPTFNLAMDSLAFQAVDKLISELTLKKSLR